MTSSISTDVTAEIARGNFDDWLAESDVPLAIEAIADAAGADPVAAAPLITSALAARRVVLVRRAEALRHLGVIVHLPDGGTHPHPGRTSVEVVAGELLIRGEGQGDDAPTEYAAGAWASFEVFAQVSAEERA